MRIIDCKQGSDEWFAARCGIPTASEFDALVTPVFKLRTGEGVETYLNRKLAERWSGFVPRDGGSFRMEQGTMLESEARPWYEFESGREIREVGFIVTDDGRCGCSPDGLFVDADEGIEIKCPAPHTQVGYLRGGELPKEYAAQVHGSMFVTGADRWTFVSYSRTLPKFVLVVERDEKAIAAIAEAIAQFNERFDAAWAKLVDINNGPPNRIDPKQDEEILYGD